MSTHEARSVEVEVLDGEKLIGTAPTEANGSWTYTVSPFSEGIHSFTARAGGNTSETYTVVGGASELPIKEDFEDIPVGKLIIDTSIIGPKSLTEITLRKGQAKIALYPAAPADRNSLHIGNGATVEIVPKSPAKSVTFSRIPDTGVLLVTYYDKDHYFLGEINDPIHEDKIEFTHATPIGLIELKVKTNHWEVVDNFEFS